MSPTRGRKTLIVRVPEDLHEAIKREAERENTTLNQWCLAVLAGAIGYRATGSDS